MGTKTEALLTDEPAITEIEELRPLIAEGQERGFLTFEQIAACLEEVEVTKEQIIELHAFLEGRGSTSSGPMASPRPPKDAVRAAPSGARQGAGRSPQARDRPDGRAEARLAAALPALDRQGRAAHGRPGGRAGEAHRARRPGRQAGDGRGEPAPRRLDRQGLPRPRAHVPGPDPGGLARPHPRGGEVRLPPRLQVLDLRDVVDPPGGDARDRGQGPHDPHPGPHGREAQQGRPRRAPARPAARPRAAAGGDRPRARVHAARGARHPAHGAAAGLAREADRRGGGVRARRLRRGRGRRVAVRAGVGEPAQGERPPRAGGAARSASAR